MDDYDYTEINDLPIDPELKSMLDKNRNARRLEREEARRKRAVRRAAVDAIMRMRGMQG